MKQYLVVHDMIRSPAYPWLVYCAEHGQRRQVGQHKTEADARAYAVRCKEKANAKAP